MKKKYLIQLDVDKGTDLFVCIDGLFNQLYSRNISYISFDTIEEAEDFWNKNSWMIDYYDSDYKNVKSATIIEVSYNECLTLSEPTIIPPDEDSFQEYENLLKWFNDDDDYKDIIQKQESDTYKSFKINHDNLIISYEHNIDNSDNLFSLIIHHKLLDHDFEFIVPWCGLSFLIMINSLDYMNTEDFIKDYDLYCKQNSMCDKLLDMFNLQKC